MGRIDKINNTSSAENVLIDISSPGRNKLAEFTASSALHSGSITGQKILGNKRCRSPSARLNLFCGRAFLIFAHSGSVLGIAHRRARDADHDQWFRNFNREPSCYFQDHFAIFATRNAYAT
jgi:hypothetical protein